MSKFVTFTRRTDSPKLEFLEDALTAAGISHQRNGASWHAPILEVKNCDLWHAWEVLDDVGDDLPDDHHRFIGATGGDWWSDEDKDGAEDYAKPERL